MSPFANWLREFRKARGLKQKDLAEQMGYEQSYVSSLEVGIKGPPTQEFVEKLTNAFRLSEDEAEQIRASAVESERKLTIPADADEQVYRLVYEMRQQIHKLLPSQVSMMLEILNMPYKMIEETKYLASEHTGKANMKQKGMEEHKM
jgi:transcriptional regulator with XRE-family HTH domain